MIAAAVVTLVAVGVARETRHRGLASPEAWACEPGDAGAAAQARTA
ncbi:hypothetical protein [Streptomyces alanosinicus]|uniref:Uncharacterized protein n=1 Tax=Streptomyces alanosinicus TaxID=68171 RepID=A0A918YGC1_9ACTN|nr:hypothetical protein [Streptomyces alanosinicus]GHE03184.1 hypothetical protein GCM10010339_29450 [Streptomyces alanosinicus]